MSEYTIHCKRFPKPNKRTIAFICSKHGFKKGDTCDECESSKPKDTVNINTGDWARGWYEHLGHDPVYIESKEHLKRECEKRGLLARALMKPRSRGKGYEHRR